jgi:hypothetical protein
LYRRATSTDSSDRLSTNATSNPRVRSRQRLRQTHAGGSAHVKARGDRPKRTFCSLTQRFRTNRVTPNIRQARSRPTNPSGIFGSAAAARAIRTRSISSSGRCCTSRRGPFARDRGIEALSQTSLAELSNHFVHEIEAAVEVAPLGRDGVERLRDEPFVVDG